MQIRGITKSDFDHIVSVSDRWWGGPSSDRTHPVFFYELGERGLVAEDNGEIIGFLFGFAAPVDPPTAYVHMVGIHPDYRRQGVAKQLYSHFADTCNNWDARGSKRSQRWEIKIDALSHRPWFFRGRGPQLRGAREPRIVFYKEL